MQQEATQALNELATDAVAQLKSYFRAEGEDLQKRADAALKLLGRINGNDSNRIKALALQLQVAGKMGIKGEPLRPLMVELNPSFARALPEPNQAPALALAESTT